MTCSRANMAVQIVQKQSVHLRCFSSTGKFLNVYALFLNILNQDPNNFYLFKFLLSCSTHPGTKNYLFSSLFHQSSHPLFLQSFHPLLGWFLSSLYSFSGNFIESLPYFAHEKSGFWSGLHHFFHPLPHQILFSSWNIIMKQTMLNSSSSLRNIIIITSLACVDYSMNYCLSDSFCLQ